MINPLKPTKDPTVDIKGVIDDIYQALTELKASVTIDQAREGNANNIIKVVEEGGKTRLSVRTSKGWVTTDDDLFGNVQV